MFNNYQAYVDFFAASILLIMIFSLIYKKSYLTINGRNLLILSLFIFGLTFFEGLTYAIDASISRYYFNTTYIINFMLFIATPLFLGFWVKYIYYLTSDKLPTVTQFIFFMIPTGVIFILLIINVFNPFIYTISSSGVYSRLSGYPYISYLSYVLVGYTFYLLFRSLLKRRSMNVYILLISNTIAFFGSFIQLSSSKEPSIYTSITLGFVIIFVFFTTMDNGMDPLTGLFNRKKMYEIINSRITTKKTFHIVSIDFDNLKCLNDQFGHFVGDAAIYSFAISISKIFEKNGICGRLGGDEFILISDLPREKIISKLEQIDRTFYCDSNQCKYEYGFSFGVSSCDDFENANIDALIKMSDTEMYKMKAIHKNFKRRKSDR